MRCNVAYRQTVLAWKDGLKILGQRSMEEVVDEMRMEGKGNGK